MPRFVRPAFLSVRVPGRATKTMSPITATGYLEADLTLRTPHGVVSRPIVIRAGAYNQKGEIDAMITIPRGFIVDIEAVGPGGAQTIMITPTNEA